MVVFQSSRGANDRVDQPSRTSRTADAHGADIAAGAGGSIEQEISLFHRPAEVATECDEVDFLNRSLPDVGNDQLSIQSIK